jgi:hypothetical protein
MILYNTDTPDVYNKIRARSKNCMLGPREAAEDIIAQAATSPKRLLWKM